MLKTIGPWVFSEDGLRAFHTGSGVAIDANKDVHSPDPRRPWRIDIFQMSSPGEFYTLGWAADEGEAKQMLHVAVLDVTRGPRP